MMEMRPGSDEICADCIMMNPLFWKPSNNPCFILPVYCEELPEYVEVQFVLDVIMHILDQIGSGSLHGFGLETPEADEQKHIALC